MYVEVNDLAGVCGNERADKLAGKAADIGRTTVLSTVQHPVTSREDDSILTDTLEEKVLTFGEGRKSDRIVTSFWWKLQSCLH